MSFRRRLTLAGAAAVAVAVALASLATYLVVRGELRGQVDETLRQSAERLTRDVVLFVRQAPDPAELPGLALQRQLVIAGGPLGTSDRYAQLVQDNGEVIGPPDGALELPGKQRAAELAAAGSGEAVTEGTVDGVHARVFTKAIGPGAALQVARPIEEMDDTLARLRWVLAAVTLGGVGLAGGLGLVVTRTALRPVSELSDTAEHVARTRDLSRRIEADGSDELSRLAESFNTMLAALEHSMRQQRQLVADASHELRTPLTSLRTNVELLAERNGVPAAERKQMLASMLGQLEELTVLVSDLVDLARDEEGPKEEGEDVRLDEIVDQAAERARMRHPERELELDLEPTVVHGVPGRLGRAVGNLLDNAQKWSPPGAPIEVTLRDGELRVRDHGPGIADEDLPLVFDRFYRAPRARGMPGSGLGLAIVRQVAESHGGSVAAERAEGGGALLRMRLGSAS